MNWLPTVRHSTFRSIARSARRNACRCSDKFVMPARRFHTGASLTYRPPMVNQSTPSSTHVSRGFRVVGAVGLGLGLGMTATYMTQSRVLFEPSPAPAVQPAVAPPASNIPPGAYDPDQPLPAPKGLANPYELTFGTICGICAGVFIKKGLKAAAFILGGVFVILQYFNSLSWLRVDWGSAENRFKQTFYATTVDGGSRPPTIQSSFTWLVNFVMADFQPRASFLAGLLLGLRVG